MTQSQRREYLIRCLLQERPEYAGLPIPMGEEEQRRLLRSLMNLRPPAPISGEIQVVGATTLDEYRKYIEKDAALERRFQPVTVGEPSQEATLDILKGLRGKYEQCTSPMKH